MNPLLVTMIVRTLAGAFTAAATPTVMNMEPSAPIPSSMEEAIAQAIMAMVVVGSMYAKSLLAKKKDQK